MQVNIRNFFLPPTNEGDPEKNQDKRTTHMVGVALLGLAVFSIPFIFQLESPVKELALGATVVGIFIWLLTIYLVKIKRTTVAKVIILVVNTLNLLSVIFLTGGLKQPTIFTLFFLLAMANLLFPRRGAIVYGSILLVAITSLFVLDLAGFVPDIPSPISSRPAYLVFVFTLVSVATVLAISSSNSQRNIEAARKNERELRERNLELDSLRGSLEERVSERTAQLEKRANQLSAISGVARAIASVQDIDQLLPDVTRLVSEQFDFYHVGIFLLDENQEYAVLQAANSEGGKRMLNRQHKLKLDSNSIVGYATSLDEPRIALDVGTDAVYFDNPDLPETHSELALPLKIGKRIIGALDVQSMETNAFTKEDIASLSVLADQVAIAIENSRLFGESNKALKESEETFSKYVKQEWNSFTIQAKHTGYLYDGNRVVPSTSKNKTEKAKSLPQTGRLKLEKETKNLLVPIRLRGQIIGYIDVKPKKDSRKWTQDDITLLEAAAERAALALENARLVESAQRRASRERTIGEISTRIGAVSDLETIMQIAVEELGRKISGTAEVTFELES